MAGTHLSFIVFLVVGGPLAARFPRVVLWHLGAIAATAAVNLSGSDCPLTTWEKFFLVQAGQQPYENGFISHYLVEPVHAAGIDGSVNLVILGAWILPTTCAYLLFARRNTIRE